MAKPQTLSPLARLLREQREQVQSKQSEPIGRRYTPPESGAPPEKPSRPHRIGGAPDSGAPPKSGAPPEYVVAPDTSHTRTANEIFDRIMPTLKPAAQIVLWRLFRLSVGFNSQTCFVTIGKLSEMCNLGKTVVRESLSYLEGRGLIKRLNVEFGAKNTQEKGITFLVKLPRLSPPKSVAPPESVTAPESVAPPDSEPNKVFIKDTHTNTERGVGVGKNVGSKFVLDECRRYANHLQKTGQGITNPGGYATTIHRTGEADEMIAKFLNPAPTPTQATIDASQCPDCNGSGWWYPKGREMGAAKCKHEKLKE